jgi:hypothetical protein
MDIEGHKGRLINCQRFRVGLPGETKEYVRSKMLSEIGSRVAHIAQDGREYALRLRVGEWHEEESEKFGWVDELRIQADLVLLDALTAEIGEWVKEMPHSVPDCKRTVILGDGHGEATGWVFRRGDFGWQRIE